MKQGQGCAKLMRASKRAEVIKGLNKLPCIDLTPHRTSCTCNNCNVKRVQIIMEFAIVSNASVDILMFLKNFFKRTTPTRPLWRSRLEDKYKNAFQCDSASTVFFGLPALQPASSIEQLLTTEVPNTVEMQLCTTEFASFFPELSICSEESDLGMFYTVFIIN